MLAQTDLSRITCMIDDNLMPLIDESLRDLSIPEVFIQRAKQIALVDRSTLLGLRSKTISEETRAWVYRFCVPQKYETAIMRRLAETADLYLPGHGSIYAENVQPLRTEKFKFNEEKLSVLCKEEKILHENYAVLCCIVQRGMASSLAAMVLEMGLCVPVISFGKGMGLRNKLGLLRITIPVEKEVIYFIVPSIDAELLEGVVVHKARLDLPGQGFIFKSYVRALSVNLRVRRGKRNYAASMEQVIAALDELRGSSEWRRLGTKRNSKVSGGKAQHDLTCLSLTAEEGYIDIFVKAAMSAGAGGATLLPLEFRSYYHEEEGTFHISHARETCDLIIPSEIQDKIMKKIKTEGFFEKESGGIAEITSVQKSVTYSVK